MLTGPGCVDPAPPLKVGTILAVPVDCGITRFVSIRFLRFEARTATDVSLEVRLTCLVKSIVQSRLGTTSAQFGDTWRRVHTVAY